MDLKVLVCPEHYLTVFRKYLYLSICIHHKCYWHICSRTDTHQTSYSATLSHTLVLIRCWCISPNRWRWYTSRFPWYWHLGICGMTFHQTSWSIRPWHILVWLGFDAYSPTDGFATFVSSISAISFCQLLWFVISSNFLFS